MARSLAQLRLVAQRILGSPEPLPAETVRWMVAMQAQDLGGAKWAVGLRTPGSTVATIDAALEAGTIVRTWPLRGTLHLVHADDVHWILALTTPRVLSGVAAREQRLGLDARTFSKARTIAETELAGGQRTRSQLLAAFARRKIEITPERGYHLLWYLAQTGVVCLGPHEGKEQAFVHLDTWVPRRRTLDRDEALGELARRYFASHGPATIDDLARWAKLSLGDARKGHAIAKPALVELDGHWMSPEVVPDRAASRSVFALPGFDEYMLGYGDRALVLDPEFADRIVPGGNGVFRATIVAGGTVIGTWARELTRGGVRFTVAPFKPLAPAVARHFIRATERYARFFGFAL